MVETLGQTISFILQRKIKMTNKANYSKLLKYTKTEPECFCEIKVEIRLL